MQKINPIKVGKCLKSISFQDIRNQDNLSPLDLKIKIVNKKIFKIYFSLYECSAWMHIKQNVHAAPLPPQRPDDAWESWGTTVVEGLYVVVQVLGIKPGSL